MRQLVKEQACDPCSMAKIGCFVSMVDGKQRGPCAHCSPFGDCSLRVIGWNPLKYYERLPSGRTSYDILPDLFRASNQQDIEKASLLYSSGSIHAIPFSEKTEEYVPTKHPPITKIHRTVYPLGTGPVGEFGKYSEQRVSHSSVVISHDANTPPR